MMKVEAEREIERVLNGLYNNAQTPELLKFLSRLLIYDEIGNKLQIWEIDFKNGNCNWERSMFFGTATRKTRNKELKTSSNK